MWKYLYLATALTLGVPIAFGQTAINLRQQSKNVDFSAMPSTKPFQTGTAIPALCSTGQAFFLTTAPAGSNIYGCAATNIWVLESGGSGTGGGAGMAAQLGDFLVSRGTATILSIGPNCSSATHCNVRFGTQVYDIATGGTATLSGGSGLAYIYISSTGVLTVGSNLTLTCSTGCTAQPGVTGFPLTSIPLFTWSATSGTWDTFGGTDQRAFLSTELLQSGAGIQLTQTPGQSTIATDPTVVGMIVAVPTTSTSACVTGSWAASNTFYYVCVNTNTWVRAALTAF